MPDSDDSDDIDMLTISREEAHRTVDRQIDTLDDIDTKAAKILRINLILLGIILTGLSIASAPGSSQSAPLAYSDLVNNYTVIGTVSLLLSTGAAAVTYTASSLKAGASAKDIDRFLTSNYSDREDYRLLVEGYTDWIQYNYKVNAKNAPLGTLTILLLILSMLFLALGVKQAATGHMEIYLKIFAVLLFILIVYLTGIIGQIRRYRRVRSD